MRNLRFLIFLAALVAFLPFTARQASAQSHACSAAYPWSASTYGGGPCFSSPAEYSKWLIASYGYEGGPTYYLVNITPVTSGESGYTCTNPATPCANVNIWYRGTSSYLIGYAPSYTAGSSCPDGSYAASGQPCGGKSLGNSACDCSGAKSVGQPAPDHYPTMFANTPSAETSGSDPTYLASSDTGGVFAGDPIDVGSGNVYEAVTDYETSGPNKLGFSRYYNSRGSFSSTAQEMGMFWRTNYDRYITLSPYNTTNSVLIERADGRQVLFTAVGSTWTPESDVDMTLTNSGTTYTLTDHDDTVETYTPNFLGSVELLTSIKYRNGYTQTLAYNGYDQLISVTDSYSRSLTFAYNGNGQISSVTTPESKTIAFGYTAAGYYYNLTSVTYPTSTASTLSYVYEDASNPDSLTGIIDENGNRYATWSYDAYSRGLTNAQGGSGLNANLTTLTYDDTDGSRTVTNALGVTDTYSFTVSQGVPKVTGISRAATSTTASATESFSYDSHGYLASAVDWNGTTTTYSNNSHGQPITIVDASGSSVARTTTIAYDSTWVHLPGSITTPGVTASYTYDSSGEPLTRTLTDTTTTTVPYSTNGHTRTWTYTWSNYLPVTIQNPRGNTTTLTFGTDGALTNIANPLSQNIQITSHNSSGLPLTIVDPNSVTTTLTYDGRQRLLTSALSTSGGVLTTTNVYDAAGNLTSVTYPDSSSFTNTYDNAHRLTNTTNVRGEQINYTLDALNDLTETDLLDSSSATQHTHSGTFDALGRLLHDIGGVSQTTVLTYDSNSNPLTITDPNTNVTTQAFDALNRLHTVTDPGTGVTTTAYDAHDRPTSVTDANSNATTWVIDGFGDRIQQTSPDSGVTVYHYDADGNLTQKVDASSVTTNYTYDTLDRIATVAYPADSSENVTYTYDQTGHGKGIGRLTSVSDAVGTLSRSYDERGNLTNESRVHGSVTLATGYTYDGLSRVASITYPSGTVVAYTRDSAGQVTAVSEQAPGATSAVTVASGITHKPFGPGNALNFGNGVAEAQGYDHDYRMTGTLDMNSSMAAILSLGFGYDSNNNILSITDAVTSANSQTLGYDSMNRLNSASASDYGAFGYTYDLVGNRATEVRGGTNTYTSHYNTGTNQLASVTRGGTTLQSLTYTGTGNMQGFGAPGDPTIAYAYNKANRAGTVSSGGSQIASYGYSASGDRIVKTYAGTPATGALFAYGQDGALLEETDLSGNPTADYIYLDGRPVGDLAPATASLYFIHSDQLGTPQLATDSTQTTVWQASYHPFGWTGSNTTGTITQNLRLLGQYFDSETGSNHNGFREYLPFWGRYAQTDPIGLGGGTNTYAYANGNPMNVFDPSGTDGIYVSYMGYKVAYDEKGDTISIGHSGVVAVDPKTGDTQYFDLGRYGGTYGDVRSSTDKGIDLGQLSFENGYPTQQSLNSVLQNASSLFGKNSPVAFDYYSDADYQKIVSYARVIQANRSSNPYHVLTFNCKEFAGQAIVEGGGTVPLIYGVVPAPRK